MQDYIEPLTFKPYCFIKKVRPLPNNDKKIKFKICTSVKIPYGYELKRNKIRRYKDKTVKKILLEFRATTFLEEGKVGGVQEFFFEHNLKRKEIECFIEENKGIPVQVVAPHDPAGRAIFHDGTSSMHPGSGD